MSKQKEMQEKFLEALFGEAQGNPHLAKKIAGYSDSTKTAQIVRNLKDEIAAGTRDYIATHAPEAVASIIAVLRNPTALGNKDKISAAKDILDRAGFKEAEKVEVTTNSPIFILPAKDEK